MIESERFGQLVNEDPTRFARVITRDNKGLVKADISEIRSTDGPASRVPAGISKGSDGNHGAFPDEPGFLGEFATRGFGGALALVDESTGECPAVAKWRLTAAHKEHFARLRRAAKDDSVAAESGSRVVVGVLHKPSVAQPFNFGHFDTLW